MPTRPAKLQSVPIEFEINRPYLTAIDPQLFQEENWALFSSTQVNYHHLFFFHATLADVVISLDTAICGKNYDHLAWRIGEIGVSRYKVMHRLQTPRSSLLDIESRRCGPGTKIVSAIALLVPALPSAFTPQNTLPSSQEISKDPRGPGSCGVGRIEPLSYGRVHRPRPMPSITIQGNRRPAGSSWDDLQHRDQRQSAKDMA